MVKKGTRQMYAMLFARLMRLTPVPLFQMDIVNDDQLKVQVDHKRDLPAVEEQCREFESQFGIRVLVSQHI